MTDQFKTQQLAALAVKELTIIRKAVLRQISMPLTKKEESFNSVSLALEAKISPATRYYLYAHYLPRLYVLFLAATGQLHPDAYHENLMPNRQWLPNYYRLFDKSNPHLGQRKLDKLYGIYSTMDVFMSMSWIVFSSLIDNFERRPRPHGTGSVSFDWYLTVKGITAFNTELRRLSNTIAKHGVADTFSYISDVQALLRDDTYEDDQIDRLDKERYIQALYDEPVFRQEMVHLERLLLVNQESFYALKEYFPYHYRSNRALTAHRESIAGMLEAILNSDCPEE